MIFKDPNDKFFITPQLNIGD